MCEDFIKASVLGERLYREYHDGRLQLGENERVVWCDGNGDIILNEAGEPTRDPWEWGGVKLGGNTIKWDGKPLFPRITPEMERRYEELRND
mgnify:CR=1 FL=1